MGVHATDDMRTNLVDTLVTQNKLTEAWAYYRTFRPGARRDRSRDPEFALHITRPAVFDWRVGSDTRLSAAILRQGSGGVVDFVVPPNVGGEVVNQLQLLPAGRYRIEGRSQGINQTGQSLPYWILTCHDGRELGRVPLTNAGQSSAHFTGLFTVPKDCRAQKLSLMVRSTDDIMGVSGQIESARLVPE